MNRHITSTSAAFTEDLAASIGAKLRGGEVIELVSDLGGGKTTFVRGLARGLGSGDRVASPTFTISREYKAAKLTLYHFDFYRLHEAGIIAAELAELLDDPRAAIAVEWAGPVDDVLPKARLTVTIVQTGEHERGILCKFPRQLLYLLPPSS